MSLHRGYIAEGKDRQHPVLDPDAGINAAEVSMTPIRAMTWYDTVGRTTTFPPTVIPVADNG